MRAAGGKCTNPSGSIFLRCVYEEDRTRARSLLSLNVTSVAFGQGDS